MNNIRRQDTQETGIKSLLDQYLASREGLKSSIGETSLHLDEDSLATFAEGSMTPRESAPVISHLVDCGFCRHKTAELVMLDLELSGEEFVATSSTVSEPTSISSVLSQLLSKIFGTSDQAVLAHREEESEKDSDEDEEKGHKND